MARENLRILAPNVVRIDGYFYHIDNNAEVLFKKTDDGRNAFSYPLDTPIDNSVVSLEYDGQHFWTQENPSGSIIFRKWKIEEFVLKHQRRYQFLDTGTQTYDSTAFAVEHFHLNLANAASSGSSILDVGTDGNERADVGDVLFIGPSNASGFEGLTQEATVLALSGASNQYLILTAPLTKGFVIGDSVSYSTRIWFFNQFRPSDPDINGSGQLFSFNHKDTSPSVIAQKAGNEFKDVAAATFLTDLPGTSEARDYLTYIKETSLLFVETQDDHEDFKSIVKSATQNNQRPDNTVIPVYELTHENNTLFRLQLEANFLIGSTETLEQWGTIGDPDYNYQLSTLERLPSSISLTATPAIISADGVSTATIVAIVRDQFDEPMQGRTVTFSDSDTSGSPAGTVNPTATVTDANGRAVTTYTAGTVSNLVTITASS